MKPTGARLFPRLGRSGQPYLRFKVDNGLCSISGPGGAPLLQGCHAAVALSSGERFTTERDPVATETERGAMLVRCPGSVTRPELRWNIEPGPDPRSVLLGLEVHNTTPRSLPVERLDVLVAPTGLAGAPASQIEVSQTGWQSWSYAAPPLPLSPETGEAPPPILGPFLPPTEADRTLVPWMALLHAPGDHSLLAGFVTATDQQGMVAIQPALGGHRLTASSYEEGVPLLPGAALASETLLLVFDTPDAVSLAEYARRLATGMRARPWPYVPTGWCSWYYYFTNVTEADVLANLEVLAAGPGRVPVDYVQIDDGYQQNIGDWLSVNDKFPGGMRALAARIKERGYKPGIWLAPFLLSERSQLYAQHPDWVVRDGAGEPVVAIHNWNSANYALDTTNPRALSWLREVVETIVNDWGYEYLKIDFLYAACLRGRRHDRNSTSVQAYRLGLETIRKAAGDLFVLGCGAPFAPSVGMVEAMRIGPDVAPFWGSALDPRDSDPATSNGVRSTLSHYWMHGSLWINDPDCVLLRESESTLTLPEVQSWATLVSMSGGMVLVSDDLAKLEPARAAIAPLLMPAGGEPALPLGPLVDGSPTRMQLTVERTWERWLVAALFNWTEEEDALTFDPREWDLRGMRRYHLFDPWTRQHFGPFTGPVKLPPTPPHGVRLLAVHGDLDRPQIVGSTLHLLQGMVEMASEEWSDGTLTVELHCPGEHKGALFIYIPSTYEHSPGDGDPPAIERRGDLLSMLLTLDGQAKVTLRFTKL